MLKINIENMEKEIEYLQDQDGITAVSTEGIGGNTNAISDVTEKTALHNLDEKSRLEKKMKRARLEVESVDRALNGLNEIERKVVMAKYMNALQWWQVSGIVFIGERQCRNIRKQAIEKIIIGVFGKEK